MSAVTRALMIALLPASFATCVRKVDAPIVPGGDAERGRKAITAYGCGSCHVIPGVKGARGLVGPSLQTTASHVYIAGVLPNDPESIVRWIMNPPAVDPKTAMPALGVPEQDARDMAEYIYRIGR